MKILLLPDRVPARRTVEIGKTPGGLVISVNARDTRGNELLDGGKLLAGQVGRVADRRATLAMLMVLGSAASANAAAVSATSAAGGAGDGGVCALHDAVSTTTAVVQPRQAIRAKSAPGSPGTGNIISTGTPAPPNDDCDNAIDVTPVLCAFTATLNTTGATDQTGEPASTCTLESHAVWYSYTNTGATPVEVSIDTCGSNYDTAVMAWLQSANQSLAGACTFPSFSAVGCSDDDADCGNGLLSSLTFIAAPGETYKLQVGGFASHTGNLTVNMNCELLATCGDGIVSPGEACDDGNLIAGDGCDPKCQIEPGWRCGADLGLSPVGSVCSEICGDGLVVGKEPCDDGEVVPGDGCSATCTVERGWSCTGAPSLCTTACGDAIIAGAEACDDDNLLASDGCSAACAVEPGWTCAGEPSLCHTTCGDGILAGAETCDDGGLSAGDGCSAGCAVERGWSCSGTPSRCAAGCGDGIIAGPEACDDGNAVDGDGCSSMCKVEATWTCTGEPSSCLRDSDGDGLFDHDDNCPFIANPDQKDSDGDDIGDACDSDRNGDGFNDAIRIRGGGGCSATGGSGWIILALAFGVVMAGRRRRRTRMAGVAGLLLVGATGIGHAQQATEPRSFDVERFQLTGAGTGVLGAEAGTVLDHGAWDLGTWFGMSDDPLVARDGAMSIPLVARRKTAALIGAIGLWDRVELGITLPVVLAQVRASSAPGISGELAPLSGGLGDLRLTPKIALLRAARLGVDVAAVAAVTLPTGQKHDYRGDSGMTVAPAIAASRALGQVLVVANLGWRMRDEVTMVNLRIDDELFTELGVGIQATPAVGFDLGFSGATQAAAPFDNKSQNHAEVRGGASLRITPALVFAAILGAGVEYGYGTPDWRVALVMRYEQGRRGVE